MEVESVKKERERAEAEILGFLRDLEERTGMVVDWVVVDRVEHQDGRSEVKSVRIDLELQR